mmetsp:Transcript_9946/g.12532  ORF Transcript_9946/g.12532 Transcript_9946/m.12532 type:complete len:291 (-) Transcript_9946:108-980(-)
MSSSLPYKQAANVERRTWDKETYEAKAKARIQAEKNPSSSTAGSSSIQQVGEKRSLDRSILNDEGESRKEEFEQAQKGRAGPLNSKRAFLKARTTKVDLESKVGKSEIINPEEAAKSSIQITDGVTPTGGGGVGWYCKVCDCYLKDSLTYLDHINGRKHQRALGYSMRTEKSTTEEVSNRLQTLIQAKKKKEEEEQKELTMLKEKDDDGDGLNEFEKIVKQKDDEIVRRKAERAKRREERKKKAREEKEAKATSKVNVGENDGEDDEEEDGGGLNPDIAKMMGFGNFGGT